MSENTTDPRDQREEGEEDAGAQDKGAAQETEAASPADDLQALADENAELRDRLLREMAEMENVRRRAEREKADTAKYAISNFARDVLTVGDNIRRTIEHVPAEAAAKDPALKSFLEGIELTERELLNMLERHGVTRIDPLGERFDPNNHQAMYEVPNPEVPEGTVVDVMQAGYVIGDRCLRPALVAVAKGGAKQSAEAGRAKPANDDFPETMQNGGGKGDS
ncbi:nucleotide exchange factor GrpE [Methyloligella sp. 2.7D]|uniref:nucleotide exchange factor GrpE n=1 Tax=unclassified Methyloligella TaxID=2625955 RepID=UPI00157D20D7|nr:nucleotide exchange factor GrpE [Methyloligella sp. GL2]QKP76161.1 nucleotide exchange factor GrpE [Methyloligella sp. GL2]